MQPRTRWLAVVGVVVVTGCSSSTRADSTTPNGAPSASLPAPCGAGDAADVRRAIDSTMAHAAAELRRTGSMESLWALYADDALHMWDNQRTWRGKAEARREAAKVLGDLSFRDHQQTTEDVLVCGDLAVQTGTFEHTLQRTSGEAVTGRGRNLIVWMRQPDGSWKIVRNLGNDAPPRER